MGRHKLLLLSSAILLAACEGGPAGVGAGDAASGNGASTSDGSGAAGAGGAAGAETASGGSSGAGADASSPGLTGAADAASPDASGGSPMDGGGAVSARPSLTAGDMPFMNLSWVSGLWVGYLENFTFPSGSDQLELLFGTNAAGANTLTVTLGDPTAPPAPTDPTAYWPGPLPSNVFPREAHLVEGFPYPAHEVTWEDLRLRFKLDAAEAWTAWCGLQKSYAVLASTPEFNCVPGAGGGGYQPGPNGTPTDCMVNDTNGPYQQVPCGQFFLCDGNHCACDATGCGPATALDTPFDMTFEMTLSGNTASGSAEVPDLHNLHVTPAP
jgi:hypothetical protein